MKFNKELIKLEKLLLDNNDININNNNNNNNNNNINNNKIINNSILNQNLIISINNFGYISSPCNILQVKELLEKYGKNGNNKVFEISKDLIKIENKSWSTTLESIIYNNRELLKNLEDNKVNIEFSKMLINEENGGFSTLSSELPKPQEGNDNDNNLFYKLVIILPNNSQESGELIVKDNNNQLFSRNLESSNIQYLIINKEFQFQLLPNSGSFRVCLVYDLIKSSKRIFTNIDHSSESLPIDKEMQIEKEIKKQIKENGKLVYVLKNKYQSIQQFNNQDKQIFEKLIKIKNNYNNNNNNNNNNDNNNNSSNKSIDSGNSNNSIISNSTSSNKKNTQLLVFFAILFSKVNEGETSKKYYLTNFTDENGRQLSISNIKVKIKKEIFPPYSIVDSINSPTSSTIVILNNKSSGNSKAIILSLTSFEEFTTTFSQLLKRDKKNNIQTDTDENLLLLEKYYFNSPYYKPVSELNTDIKTLINSYLSAKMSRIKRIFYKKMVDDLQLFLENLDFPIKKNFSSKRMVQLFGDSSIKFPQLFLDKLEKISTKLNQEEFASIFQTNIGIFLSNIDKIEKFIPDKKNIVNLFKNHADEFISNYTQIISVFKLDNSDVVEILKNSKSVGEIAVLLIKITQLRYQKQEKDEKTIDYSFVIEYIKLNQCFFLPSLKNNIKEVKEFVPQVLPIYPQLIQEYKKTIDSLIDKYTTLNINILNPKPVNTAYYKLLIGFCSVLGSNYNDQLQELKVKAQLKFTKLLCGPMEEMIKKINIKSPISDIWNFIYSFGCQFLIESYCQSIQLKFFMQLVQVFRPNENSIESCDAFHKSLVTGFILSTFTNNTISQYIKNSKYFNINGVAGFLDVVMNLYIRTKVKSYSINIKITCTHKNCTSCSELNNFFRDSSMKTYRWCDLTQSSMIKAKELVLFLSIHSDLVDYKQIQDIHFKQMFLIEKKESNCTKIISPYNNSVFINNLKQLLYISKSFSPNYFNSEKINIIQSFINLN